MKILHCDSRRDEIQKTVYSCGEFAYEYISDFARNLPDNVPMPVLRAAVPIRKEMSIWVCAEIPARS